MTRTLVAIALVVQCAAVHAGTEVRLWHSLDAALGEQLERLAAEYNGTQKEFRVRLEPLTAAGERSLVRLGLPLNTARPVLYYNRDAFQRANVQPPKTWYDMAGVLGTLSEAGHACGYTTSWPAWVMMQNTGGAFSRQLMVRWTSMLATWEKSGFFSYSGRSNEAEARFTAGECAVLTSSSASGQELVRRAKFSIGMAPLPAYEDSGAVSPTLPAIAPAVWVERQSVGVTSFFAFLAGKAAEARRQREVMEVELEAVWRGKKTALDALNAVSR